MYRVEGNINVDDLIELVEKARLFDEFMSESYCVAGRMINENYCCNICGSVSPDTICLGKSRDFLFEELKDKTITEVINIIQNNN